VTRAQLAGAVVLVFCAIVWFVVLLTMEPAEPGHGQAPTPAPTSVPGPPVEVGR
jgi:hypothetical protein